MRIQQIRLSNFRQYRDIVFDFSEAKDAVLVLVGKNGTGKTNLLNAITWCLYGDEKFGSKKVDNRNMPVVNVGPLGQHLSEGRTECSVEMRIVFDDGRIASIVRRQKFDVRSADEVVPSGQSDFKVQVMKDQRGFDTCADPQGWIKAAMPERVRPYYILNTERLEQFFHQDTESTRVRDAILQVAQIDLLARMRRRLQAVKADYYSPGDKDKDGLLSLMKQERQELEVERLDTKGKISAMALGIERLDDTIASLDKRMGDFESASRVIAERTEKEGREKALQAEYDVAEAELMKALASEAPAVFGYQAVQKLRAQIDEAWKTGRIPAPVHPDYLQELLEQERCVCGRGLDPESDEAGCVAETKASLMRATEFGQFVQTQSGPAAVLASRAEQLRARVGSLQTRLGRLADEGRELKARIGVLKQQMAELGIESETFALVKDQWDHAQRAREKTRTDLALLKRDEEEMAEKLEALERKLNFAMRKDQTQRALAELVRFTEQCHDAVSLAYEQLITETRESVSAALNKSFLDMIWKKQTFTGAHIDENYGVCVTSAQGWNAGDNLGGGEDVCLALGFSQALGEVSGFELPLIFDSPLVKLDDEVKVRVADTMGRNLKGRQLILLMKPDEFNDDVKRALRANVSVEVVTLDFDEPTQTTTIAS